MRILRINFGIVVCCCLLIAACTQKTQPVGPKFKGRLLVLSGDSATGMNLLELTAGPNDTFNYTSITSAFLKPPRILIKRRCFTRRKTKSSCAICTPAKSNLWSKVKTFVSRGRRTASGLATNNATRAQLISTRLSLMADPNSFGKTLGQPSAPPISRRPLRRSTVSDARNGWRRTS